MAANADQPPQLARRDAPRAPEFGPLRPFPHTRREQAAQQEPPHRLIRDLRGHHRENGQMHARRAQNKSQWKCFNSGKLGAAPADRECARSPARRARNRSSQNRRESLRHYSVFTSATPIRERMKPKRAPSSLEVHILSISAPRIASWPTSSHSGGIGFSKCLFPCSVMRSCPRT